MNLTYYFDKLIGFSTKAQARKIVLEMVEHGHTNCAGEIIFACGLEKEFSEVVKIYERDAALMAAQSLKLSA